MQMFFTKNPSQALSGKTLETQKIIPAKGVVQQASFCHYFLGGPNIMSRYLGLLGLQLS